MSTEPTTTAPEPTPPLDWWRRRRDANAYAHAQRRLEAPMLVLSIVFVIALVIGEVGDLQGGVRFTVFAVNIVIWFAFLIEYLWLLRLAPDRRRFVRTHVLDLVIILVPFLRPLRALRAFRGLRLLRFVRVIAVAGRAWQQIVGVMRHRGLGGILVIVVTMLLLGGLAAYALEPDSFANVGDAIWWVLVTSTTVGYGDFAPVGLGARAVAVVVMVLGVGLVGLITANIVDFLVGQTASEAADADTEPQGALCPSCERNEQRLVRIEAQLDAVLARTAGSASDDTPGEDGPSSPT